MEASSGRSRVRLIVVDFLATLFVTFCIGIATALVLGACVVLMTGEAHGAVPAKPCGAPLPNELPAAELVLAHYLTARYAGPVAFGRFYAAGPVGPQARCAPALTVARRMSHGETVQVPAAPR